MRVKLTDLLDDLELAPELLPLPEAKRPTRARTERLVLQRLGISRRRVRSAGRTLLAAVLAALLSLGAVAGVLGLRALSRADLGVTQPEKIPEYTEYEAASQDAGARLVSSFCAGKRLIAYIDVPDVTAEMNHAYQEAMDTYGLSLWSCRAKPYSVWAEALTYDESLQTALLRVELYTYEALEPGEVTIELCFDSQENGHETAGEVFATATVPVLPSEALQAAPELSVPSDFLKASAVIGSLTLDAGTLRLTLQAPTLDSYLNARGDGALDTLVKGYFGQDTENPTELDAQVAYRRSWNGALNELFADAALEFADGTQTPLSALFENSACFFSASLSETRDELGLYTFEAALSTPVALADVQAIEIAGQEISFAD